MSDTPGSVIETLSPEAREALERTLVRVARQPEALEQSVEFMERLAESGVLAAVNSMLEGFDENFNAFMRPEVMGMVSNLMMLLGVLSETSYEPFFHLATRAPGAVNEAYPGFERRAERLSPTEALTLMRSPEFAGALEMMVAVMRSLRTAPPGT